MPSDTVTLQLVITDLCWPWRPPLPAESWGTSAGLLEGVLQVGVLGYRRIFPVPVPDTRRELNKDSLVRRHASMG